MSRMSNHNESPPKKIRRLDLFVSRTRFTRENKPWEQFYACWPLQQPSENKTSAVLSQGGQRSKLWNGLRDILLSLRMRLRPRTRHRRRTKKNPKMKFHVPYFVFNDNDAVENVASCAQCHIRLFIVELPFFESRSRAFGASGFPSRFAIAVTSSPKKYCEHVLSLQHSRGVDNFEY